MTTQSLPTKRSSWTELFRRLLGSSQRGARVDNAIEAVTENKMLNLCPELERHRANGSLSTHNNAPIQHETETAQEDRQEAQADTEEIKENDCVSSSQRRDDILVPAPVECDQIKTPSLNYNDTALPEEAKEVERGSSSASIPELNEPDSSDLVPNAAPTPIQDGQGSLPSVPEPSWSEITVSLLHTLHAQPIFRYPSLTKDRVRRWGYWTRLLCRKDAKNARKSRRTSGLKRVRRANMLSTCEESALMAQKGWQWRVVDKMPTIVEEPSVDGTLEESTSDDTDPLHR